MKCIKNNKTGKIDRVEDLVANRMVGTGWSYISKTEWKSVNRSSKVVDSESAVVETVKAVKNKKVKNDRKA